MYMISALYKEYLQKRSREWLIKANIDGTDYGSNVIVDFEVDNSISGSQELELGTAVLGKLTLRLKTADVIPPNAKVIPYLALQLPPVFDGANVAWQNAEDTWDTANYPWQGDISEWLPLGEFFVSGRDQVNNIWVFECYDKLYLADVPYVSALTYPTTQQAVWDEICTSLGYTYDSSVVIGPTYQIQVGPAGYSKRQVLAYIASANAACLYISKDGTLRFRRFDAADQPVTELTRSDFIRAKQTNPVKTYTRIVVTYNTDDDLSYEAGTGDDNHTLQVENPFATQAITDALYARLNGFSYTPMEMDARGYPQIEVGDRVRYGMAAEALTWDGADIAWENADFSWDSFYDGGITLALSQVYTFKGGLKLSLDAPSKSEQQSEFKVDGTLTGQINKLNQTAVREGRDYFGLTITRTDGLIIEREDHASKVTLNSDKFEFLADGDQALWFDLPSQRFKFSGTLEAADGVFSGDLSAVGGTFTGELQAATGTFSGDLSAAGGTFTGTLSGVDGDFSGDISASTITGGTITGALIRTSASGARVEIDASGLRSFDENGISRIEIYPVGMSGYHQQRFRGQSGVSEGVVSATDGQFNVAASNYLALGGVSGGIFVDAANFDFQNVPIFGVGGFTLLISNISGLQAALNNKVDAGSTDPYTITDHNHGIPSGTVLRTADGGTVTFLASGGFTHSHTI